MTNPDTHRPEEGTELTLADLTPGQIAAAMASMWTQQGPVSPRRREAHRIASEVRRLADLLVRTDADIELLAATADAIAATIDRLATGGVRDRHEMIRSPRSQWLLAQARQQSADASPPRVPGPHADDRLRFAESSTAAELIAEALADPSRADELHSEHGHFDDSPIVGLANPLAPPVHIEILSEKVVGWATFGEQYEGPPGYVHGGYVAAAFDDVLGMAQSLGGQPGMTGRLTIHYRRPHPLHTKIRYEAWLERVDGRKTIVAGASYDGETLLGQAEGLFIAVDFAKLFATAPAAAATQSAADPPAPAAVATQSAPDPAPETSRPPTDRSP